MTINEMVSGAARPTNRWTSASIEELDGYLDAMQARSRLSPAGDN